MNDLQLRQTHCYQSCQERLAPCERWHSHDAGRRRVACGTSAVHRLGAHQTAMHTQSPTVSSSDAVRPTMPSNIQSPTPLLPILHTVGRKTCISIKTCRGHSRLSSSSSSFVSDSYSSTAEQQASRRVSNHQPTNSEHHTLELN